MVQLRLKGPQIASDLGTVSVNAGAANDSIQVSSFQRPRVLTGLPRISDGFDTDTLTLDMAGLTGITAYDWRTVGGATQGTGPTLAGAGLGGQYIECAVSCDQGLLVSPPVMVYTSVHMGMAMDAGHLADDAAILAIVPHREATHIAVADGDWTDPATWLPAEVPRNGAFVLVPHGRSVKYDNEELNIRLDRVRIDGRLWVDAANLTTEQLTMLLETGVTTRGGEREIGTSSNRIPATASVNIIFSGKDYGAKSHTPTNLAFERSVARDPRLWSRGWLTQGINRIWGAEKKTWVRASEEVTAGMTSILMETVPTGWAVGDEIVIGATNFVPGAREDEYRTITAINGNDVTFTPALTYDHNNQLAVSTRTGLYPVVMLRDAQNVRFSSEVTDIDARRGHTADMHHHCEVDVWGASFIGLGRTNKEDANPAGVIDDNDDFFYAEGVIVNTETLTATSNLQSRYPVHAHHVGFAAAGARPRYHDCYVEDAPGWAMVHHNCAVDMFNNAMHLFQGAGMVSESANEVGAWVGNLAMTSKSDNGGAGSEPKTLEGVRGPRGDVFRWGYGFAMRGRAMRVNGNVANSCTWGYVFFHRVESNSAFLIAGAKDLDRDVIDLKEVRKGFFQPGGLDTSTLFSRIDYPIIHFEDNESIACIGGMFVSKNNPQQRHDVNVHLKRFKSWGHYFHGAFIEYIGNYLLSDFDLISGQNGNSNNGIRVGGNTYQIGAVNCRTEGHTYALEFLGSSDVQNAHDLMDNTENPRYYIIGHDSVNESALYTGSIPTGATNTLADVVLVDPDLQKDGYDRDQDPTETFPLYLSYVDYNNPANNTTPDNTDGTKVDTISSSSDCLPKAWGDNILDFGVGIWAFNFGYYQYDGKDVIPQRSIFSDRASARPAKVCKLSELVGSIPGSYTDNGALSYTATPVTGHDITQAVSLDTATAVDVPTASGAAGGSGIITIDDDDFIAPGHGEVSLDAETGQVTYTPDAGYSGTDEMYVFLESDDQYKTVALRFLVGAGGSVTTPVVDTHFAASDGGSQTIDVDLISRPATGGRKIKWVQYSTDSGVTWRTLCNGWPLDTINIDVESDGTAIAAGGYNVLIRYMTDFEWNYSTASADDTVTVA